MIRPVDAGISQRYGDNPTKDMPRDSWLIQTFGNYQPDGHSGEDYACDIGTPVRAVASGTVLHIGKMGGAYADNPWWIAPNFAGYVAVIDHGSFIGIYGHCKDGSAKVAKGQRVSEGQVFILSGNTGGSTGPHLHFEILPDGYILNSRMYGRVDPAALFGGLSYQSESFTPLEDTLSAADVDRLINETQAQQDITRQFLADRVKDATLAILNTTQAQEDVTRAYLVDTTQAQADVTRQYLSDRIRESSPVEIAELVPDEIAQQVIDALATRLGGK